MLFVGTRQYCSLPAACCLWNVYIRRLPTGYTTDV